MTVTIFDGCCCGTEAGTVESGTEAGTAGFKKGRARSGWWESLRALGSFRREVVGPPWRAGESHRGVAAGGGPAGGSARGLTCVPESVGELPGMLRRISGQLDRLSCSGRSHRSADAVQFPTHSGSRAMESRRDPCDPLERPCSAAPKTSAVWTLEPRHTSSEWLAIRFRLANLSTSRMVNSEVPTSRSHP